MVKVRYTPKGRGTLNDLRPGDETEVSEAFYQRYKARFTLLADAPDEPIERPTPEPERIGATEAIKMIGEIEKVEDLAQFLDDDRKSVRQRAEGRKRALSQ